MASIGAVTGEIRLVDAYSVALKKLDGQLSRMESRLSALTTSSAALTAATKRKASAFDNLGSHIKNTLIHVGTAVVAFKAIGAAIDSVGKRVEFVRTLTTISNVTSTTTEELERFVGGLDAMVKSTGRGPQELAKGFYVVASVMDDATIATGVLNEAAKLAAIGLGDTNAIARALSSSINAYGKENLTAAQAANQLLVAVKRGGAEAGEMAGVFGRIVGVANELGISFAEVAASIATFTRLGVGADEAVTALRGTMNALIRPTKQAREDVNLLAPAFGRATMSIADLRQEIKDRGLADVLVTVTNAFGGNIDALGELFPNVRALAGVLGNAGSQAEVYKDILHEVRTNTDAVNVAMENTRKSASFRWDALKAQFETLALTLGEKLLPGFEAMGVALTSIDPQELADFGISATRALTALGEILKVILNHLDLLKYTLLAIIGIKFSAALEAWGRSLLVTANGAKGATVAFTSLRVSVAAIGGAVTIAVAALLFLSEKAKQYSEQALKDIDTIVAHAAAAGRALDIIRSKGKGATQGGYLEQLSAVEEKTARLAQVTKEIGEVEARQEIRRTGQNNIRLKQLRTEQEALNGEIKLHKDAAAVIVETSVATGRWSESVDTLEYEWDSFWGTWVKKKEVGVTGLGELTDAQKNFAQRIDETIEKLIAQHDAAQANLDLAIATQRARLSGGGDEIEARIAQQKEIQLRVTQAINALETHKNKLSADQLSFITRIVTKTVQLENEAEAVVALTRELVKLSKQAADRFSEFADAVADVVAAQKQAGGDQMTDSVWFTGPFQITQLEKQLDLTNEVVAAWMRGGEFAARAVRVQQQALEHNVKLTDEQADAIVRLQVEQEKLNYLIEQVAAVSMPMWARYYDAAFSAIDGVVDVFGDALTQMLQDGEVSWDSLWEGLKNTAIDIFVDLMKQMLKQWLYTQAAMAATDYASNSGGGASGMGGGGGWMNMLTGMFGGGGGGGGAGALAGHEGAHTGQAAAGGGGGAGGTMAAAGWAALIVALVLATRNQIKTSGRAEVDTEIVFGGGQGIALGPNSRHNSQVSGGQFQRQLEAIQKLIDDVVAFIGSLGGTIDKTVEETSRLLVGREGRGKKTNWFVKYANGLVKHFGDDMEAAFEFAMVQAIRQAPVVGLAPEVVTALANTMAESMDQLQADLDTAFAVLRARIGEVGADIYQIYRDFETQIAAAQQLGLATDSLVAARNREIQAVRNQLLGIDTSTADFLASLLSFQKGMEQTSESMRQGILAQIAALQAEMDAIMSPGGGGMGGPGSEGGGEGGVTGGRGGRGAIVDFSSMDPRIIELQRQIDAYLEELDRIPQALSDQELSMAVFDALYRYVEGSRKYEAERHKWARLKVELEFAAIKAQLIALGKWEEFAELFNDAYAAALRAAGKNPGRRGGGGSGTDTRAEDRDAIRREAGGFGLSALESQLRAADLWLQDFTKRIKEAGFGAAETTALLAQAAEEHARIQSEIRLGVVERFQAMLGIGQDPFSKLRTSFDDMHKEIDDAGFGAARAARMHNRLNAALDAQLVALSQQEFLALGDNLFGFLEKYYGDVEGFDNVRLAMEELRFHLELEAMRARFELLKAEGKLAEDLITKLGGIFKFIDANPPDITKFIHRNDPEPPVTQLSDAIDDAARAIEELARRFASAKEAIADFVTEMAGGKHGVITSRQAFEFQQKRFNETLALAKTGEINALEAIPDAGRDLLEALAKFSPALLAIEFPKIQTDMTSLLDLTTARDENVFVDERFQQRHAEQIAVQRAGFSAMATIGETQISQQSSMISQLTDMVASQNRLSERLSLIEAQQTTLKRSVSG